jgi:hypothetical protein
MRKFALALAAAAAFGFTAPAFATDNAAGSRRMQLAHADVKAKVGGGERRHVKKVVIKRDRGMHRGWAHSRHYGASKKVVIKKHGNGTTVKKVIKHG